MELDAADRAEYYRERGLEALRLAGWSRSLAERALLTKLALRFQQLADTTATTESLIGEKPEILAAARLAGRVAASRLPEFGPGAAVPVPSCLVGETRVGGDASASRKKVQKKAGGPRA